jgi:DNA mismatch repair ATPase MutS
MASLKKQVNNLLDHRFWKKNENICTQYFKICELCDEIYNKGLVLMQVGSFFEAYGIDNKYTKKGHANLVSSLFNMAITRRNKKKYVDELGNRKIEDLTEKQLIDLHTRYCLMSGMNDIVIEKYLRIAIENGYTVILIEQVEAVTKGTMVKREVTRIVSPGTYIETSSKDKNNIVSVFIEKVMKENIPYFCVGLSLIDATTGENLVSEVYDKKYDKNFALDEAIRFILSNTTSEILINTKNVDMSENEIISRLQLYNHKLVNVKINELSSDFYKINFQEKFLKKIFPNTGLLKAYEYLDMERMDYARLSYIILLNHIYQYNEILIKSISKPVIICNDKYLNLDTTTISQLNITNNKTISIRTKYTSLFDVINFTSTAMGRRLLKQNILNPIVSVSKLNKKYDIISDLITEDKYKNYLNYLTEMNDLERIHRKMLLELLNPYEIDGLLHNYTVIPDIIDLSQEDETKSLLNIFTSDPIESLNTIVNEIETKFDIRQMKKYALSKIEDSFFKRGANTEIDKLSDTINENITFLKEFNQKISDLIELGSQQTRSKSKNKLFSNLDKYDKSGHYIKMTNSRSKCLQVSLKEKEFIEVGNQKIPTKDISLKKKDASNKMIQYYLIDECSDKIILSQEKMKSSAKEFYLQIMKDIHEKHNSFFKQLERYISELDVLVSGARCAIENNYCKPNCVDGESSYIESKELRHPLVEKLTEIPYVSNDCNLKDGKNGILLYGVNGVGKCMSRDTPILMYDGTIKMVQDIQIGELLMGDDSTPRKVLSTTTGIDEMYKISNKKGDTYTVNSKHILCLKSSYSFSIEDRKDRKSYSLKWFCVMEKRLKSKSLSYKNRDKEQVLKEIQIIKKEKQKLSKYFEISVENYLKLPKSYHGFLSGYKVGVEFPEKEVDIDPYIIGLWLGDGNSRNPAITNQDACILKYLSVKIKEYDCYLHYDRDYTYRFNSLKPMGRYLENNFILKNLRKYNLLKNKHIPHIYKCNSRKNRLKLLAGLLDSDGYYVKGGKCYEIIQKNSRLSEDIEYLCRSLGFACHSKKCKKSCMYKGRKREGEYNKMNIYGDGLEDIPVLCPRKKADKRIINKDALSGVIEVKSVGKDKYYGFETDGNHKYILGNFIVTHNSVFLKSIGLNVVLAQSGNFIAAKEFNYCPFHTILTRILGSDNIFTNSSSFQVEMQELRAILQRANNRSLVLTDELCRGTEYSSATSLVAASIIKLSELSSKFVLTTHLHKLCHLEEITSLDNVSIEHMRVCFDEDNNLIYDRKIERGRLENISYGVYIAEKLGLSEIPDFIMTAEKIRKKLMNKSSEVLPVKKSVYNAKLYVNDCEICKDKAVDTHHIRFQEDADKKGFFDDVYYHKNHIGNLVALCKKCHDDVHNGDLEIQGKVFTSNGVKILHYRKEKKKKKGKYTEEQINRIMNLKDEPFITQKKASIQLKKRGIDISAGTVGKYWRNG